MIIALCCGTGCSTLNIHQLYPKEYEALTADESARNVRSVFLPSDRASGAHNFAPWIVTPGDRELSLAVTPVEIQVRGCKSKFVGQGETRINMGGSIITSPGQPYGIVKAEEKEIATTRTYRWNELQSVKVRTSGNPRNTFTTDPDFVAGGYLRGDYNIWLNWGWSSYIVIETSKDNLKSFVLSVSKLAPQATIKCNAKFLE